jgi:hypothetical protein
MLRRLRSSRLEARGVQNKKSGGQMNLPPLIFFLNLALTRFLYANRKPLRSKTL